MHIYITEWVLRTSSRISDQASSSYQTKEIQIYAYEERFTIKTTASSWHQKYFYMYVSLTLRVWSQKYRSMFVWFTLQVCSWLHMRRNTYFPRTKHWRHVCLRENDLVSIHVIVTYEEPSLRTCNECNINEAHKEWEARGGLLGAESLTVTLLRSSAPQISAMHCVSS